jgi:sporulation protein YlmC with PRC-barrel domain
MIRKTALSAIALSAIAATSAMGQTATPAPTPPATAPTTPAPMTSTPAPMTSTGGVIYSAPMSPGEWRSSDLVGKSVYNAANERIGEIEDMIVGTDGRVVAAVVGVGGFLGIGERKVALSYPTLQMMRDSNGAVRPVVNASRELLRDAPEYKFPRMN